MGRIQIYLSLFLLTFFLTPMVFLWENGFQLAFWLTEKPYALHWIPEVLCLLFCGMLITSVGESCSKKYPQTKTKIKQTFFVVFFGIGSFLLGINLLFFRNLEPTSLMGFFWGSLPLLGYLIETKVISDGK